MAIFKQLAITSAPTPPSVWYRYVDDTFVKIRKDAVDDFTHHINSLDPHIKFTSELEKEGQLAFLDTLVTRRDDGTIKVAIYRKATHTDQYLDFHSHHPLEHKLSVIRTLMNRADTTVTEPGDLAEEHNHIKQALRICGYKDWTFTSASIKSKPNPVPVSSDKPPQRHVYATLPFIEGISNKLRRAYQEVGVTTSFKPHKTLRKLLVAPKDKPPHDQTSGTVYKFKCGGCTSTYIGESGRPLGKRIKEHCSVRKLSTSAISEHIRPTNHQFDPEQVEILAKETKDFPRRVLEAIYIKQQEPSLNRDQGLDLDPIWDPIIKN